MSRDQTGWTGSVVFRETQPQKALHAQVSYSVNQAGLDVSPTDLESKDLGRPSASLPRSLGQAQTTRLCCNSFTIIYRPGDDKDDVARMRYISFSCVRALLRSLEDSMGSWDTLALRPDENEALSRALQDILLPLFGTRNWTRIDSSYAILHYSALAAQLLSLAFLSYSQGHVGALRPFFLDTPVEKVTLCGAGPAAA